MKLTSNKSLEDLVKTESGGIFNNAAQVWNHTFYWNCLAPNAGGAPTGAVADAINKEFGNNCRFFCFFHFSHQKCSSQFERSEAKGRAEPGIGLAKKKWTKKKDTTTTTNFVPGLVKLFTFLSKFFAFLSLFQPPKTFSYIFHFHNLSKRHSEK